MARRVGTKLDTRDGKNVYVGEVNHLHPDGDESIVTLKNFFLNHDLSGKSGYVDVSFNGEPAVTMPFTYIKTNPVSSTLLIFPEWEGTDLSNFMLIAGLQFTTGFAGTGSVKLQLGDGEFTLASVGFLLVR